ncbi:hypothetical protein Syun_031017 [Stephania yunnanensis]|uniref:Transmembrane protein n=1 Tax=Stephania yunnanensis TaxID=152371 RepID=A0AAP0HGM6_9MAGN
MSCLVSLLAFLFIFSPTYLHHSSKLLQLLILVSLTGALLILLFHSPSFSFLSAVYYLPFSFTVACFRACQLLGKAEICGLLSILFSSKSFLLSRGRCDDVIVYVRLELPSDLTPFSLIKQFLRGRRTIVVVEEKKKQVRFSLVVVVWFPLSFISKSSILRIVDIVLSFVFRLRSSFRHVRFLSVLDVEVDFLQIDAIRCATAHSRARWDFSFLVLCFRPCGFVAGML